MRALYILIYKLKLPFEVSQTWRVRQLTDSNGRHLKLNLMTLRWNWDAFLFDSFSLSVVVLRLKVSPQTQMETSVKKNLKMNYFFTSNCNNNCRLFLLIFFDAVAKRICSANSGNMPPRKKSRLSKKSSFQRKYQSSKNNPDGVLKRPKEKKKFMDMTPESQEVSPTVDHVGPQVLQSQHGPALSEERRQNESGRTSLSIRSLFNYQKLS